MADHIRAIAPAAPGIAGPMPARARVESIDVARGIIMILMALDHVHDFFGDLTSQPTNLDTTTAALFFTRWITHFCAPMFFLLTGVGACLTRRRLHKAELARFLLSRGLWLIFLELVVMRFALQFNVDYQVTIITVLWALGWAMIVLAALIWLPAWAIAGMGVAMIVGHNALDGVAPFTFDRLAPLWTVLHVPGPIFDNGRSLVFVAYVLVPWVGVTALGYVLGQVYRMDAAGRRAWLGWLGVGLCVAFVVVRLANVYGDPRPWSTQTSVLWTVMSFIDTNKYPPSLLFLLMTLGPALLLLRAFDRGVPGWLRPALVIGKVPLFFYVLHFFLIHLLAVAASWWRYGRVSEMFESPDLAHFPFSQPSGWGASVPVLYLIWLAVLVLMFPLCRWYAGVKRRRTDWWLSYL
ncbi:DUF1624 domain-containing protein [Rhodanobacter lindaniclasticus]|nr:heparan-alpha-glucosaminide N-acetyltransferase domain-containing protein [Rhodanobacter lindaniclasticus]